MTCWPAEFEELVRPPPAAGRHRQGRRADVVDEDGLHRLLAAAESWQDGHEAGEAEDPVEGVVGWAVDPGRPNDDPLEAALGEELLRPAT